MLAYRHAFHAGNHADVLKHTVLVAVLRYMAGKETGFRLIDTHAGAGGYSLKGDYASKKAEFDTGIGPLWAAAHLPPALADLVALVRRFNGGADLPAVPDPGRTPAKVVLQQYPGSPALAQLLLRPQDQGRLFELHPTDHKILQSFLGNEPGFSVSMSDGFAALKSQLPPPTRRAVLLIDPPYEMKTDYPRVLAALREALTLLPQAVVLIWLPQLQLLEAAQLPQRLKATADAQGKKGWLHARLTVALPDARGFGLLGSSVLVVNPPHTLQATLAPVLPLLAQLLGQFDGARGVVEVG